MNLMISLARWYAGAALPAKKNVRGGIVAVGVRAEPVVQHDDAQRVQQLPLVLVDALDLAVEDGVAGRRVIAAWMPQPVDEAQLGVVLGCPERGAEARVFGQRLEAFELREVGRSSRRRWLR